ncbi:hypothetical protein ANCCEY_14615 [Ancylostoma ceylanicum]|uniref:Myosin motor domain-containing protein n=1 Tax=Ancylostoma ceylanicum TaxID=53326 RepID=A0A0D6L599_9BILA|nr:hypothetical protein ANCCEY_14615 [Ancylostoma ceylanicum]
MKQSRTLPRCRPSEAPPPVPNRLATVNRLLDVHRLKDEIDKLSQQLLMVKAQLDSKLSDAAKREEHASSRGVAGSGKSQIAELVCLDIVRRLCRGGSPLSALHAAFVALRPFVTINDKHNNQSSRAVISACILLNNLSFKEIGGSIDIENLSDLEDASVLLGVSALAMYRAVMRCTLTGRDSIRECQSSRDQLVSALYTRVVRRILMRANACLDNLQDLTGSSDIIGSETRFIHVVDSPGYVCNKTNSLSELLINTVNDSLAGYSTEKASDLLQRIELSNKVCGSSSMRR